MATASHPFPSTQKSFTSSGKSYAYYSLPELGKTLGVDVSRLPVSIRIVLESVLRNCDGARVAARDVETLARYNAKHPAPEEIPFVVARIVLQDFTGVPLLVDLAAMRSAVAKLGKNPKIIEPLVPVDLVVDHSVQVDYVGAGPAFDLNLKLEFERNRERYQFLKWGMQAFDTFKVVPPGIGIVHQVNLEYLAKGVLTQKCEMGNAKVEMVYPDTLVGTDSHTTMINGLGIVGWGVGGIEAEAGMLGQPVYFLTPEVVGVHLTGSLQEGVTATDLVLRVTEMLRKAKVVGKFVEFYGPGAIALPVTDRATIANMAPEYGATMGFFPIDEETIKYMAFTGRSEAQCALFADYYQAQSLFGIPSKGEVDYTIDLELDLSTVVAAVAGPKRPQDRIDLPRVADKFTELFSTPKDQGGFGKKPEEITFEAPVENSYTSQTLEAAGFTATDLLVSQTTIGHGSVLIAAITSCTNTSNPSVMLAAGLLAKKAIQKGMVVDPKVKCSLAPGSRVVSDYLQKANLQTYLDQLGFNLVGYGCTTCIGNSGPLAPAIEEAIVQHDLVAASVLSGNRNFEARVHGNIKANFLMSPPLVVAFALAGTVNIDLTSEPLGKDRDGLDVYLRDLWPTLQEVQDIMAVALKPEVFQKLYTDFEKQNPAWNEIPSSVGELYDWDRRSTYIQEPPFFENFGMAPGSIAEIKNARPLGIFGDSVTTDHISPAGSFKKETPAGRYLLEQGVQPVDFNSYGSRRGNDRIMTRGTFANVRIKNLMVPGVEGGVTKCFLTEDGETLSIYDAAMKYKAAGVPLIVIGGKEYGTGSSRDWAAKGTNLLGVKVVVAETFERIHRSNLVGMGVLPLCFKEGTSAATLGLDGTETYSIGGLGEDVQPRQDLTLEITRANGSVDHVPVTCRIDTPIEVEYYRHGGILPYVLRQIVAAAKSSPSPLSKKPTTGKKTEAKKKAPKKSDKAKTGKAKKAGKPSKGSAKAQKKAGKLLKKAAKKSRKLAKKVRKKKAKAENKLKKQAKSRSLKKKAVKKTAKKTAKKRRK
ncbi:MAG: aconitate hydratase AcnA [Candidatus Methylacidiphilales bacterium]|nr:aconitate hydratase AcnA [Candidatus Methylacidiphilales bacterium]